MLLKRLYDNRFSLFLFSQLLLLFGSIFADISENKEGIISLIYQFNLLVGILLISKNKALSIFFFLLFILTGFFYWITLVPNFEIIQNTSIRLLLFFIFNSIVCYHLILQVWRSAGLNENVILGVICGYLSLGMVGYLIFLLIETYYPGSFHGISADATIIDKSNVLMYFSYITMLTIGYGDIYPLGHLAQKATVLIGLIGQVYIVILTAIMIAKYVNSKQNKG